MTGCACGHLVTTKRCDHTLDISEAGAKADAADAHASSEALRALHKLVGVLCALPAHVAA